MALAAAVTAPKAEYIPLANPWLIIEPTYRIVDTPLIPAERIELTIDDIADVAEPMPERMPFVIPVETPRPAC